MTSLTLPRPLIWGIILLVALGIFLPTSQLPAQDTGCKAVDRNDLPRDCTFLEEHGYCLVTALESYDQCKEDADSFFDHHVCELGVQVDLLACNAGLPLTLLRSLNFM
jgi:hypothetical protein